LFSCFLRHFSVLYRHFFFKGYINVFTGHTQKKLERVNKCRKI
jgi:hypothetical protein